VLPLLNVGFDPVRAFSAGLIDIIGDFVAERGVLPAAEVDAWKADLVIATSSASTGTSSGRSAPEC
jgi:hypothetical protein